MNKLFTKIAGVTLGFAMAIGVGAAVAGSKNVVPVRAEEQTGTINFGSAAGSTKVDAISVSGNDSLGNTWTVETVTTAASFTQNSEYSQIGASKKPATSITFSTTLPSSQTITDFSAKFGGFSGTAGTITLKIGESTVGTGNLNATTDVTVGGDITDTSGTVLTVTVTNIAKGVKAYYISYSYDDGGAGTKYISVTESATIDIVSATKTATLTATKKNGASGTVTWTIDSGSDYVSLPEENTGDSIVVTALAVGDATIKAVCSDCDEPAYSTVHVVDVVHAGTMADPLSVADALLIAHRNGSTDPGTNYFIHGFISNKYYYTSSHTSNFDLGDTTDSSNVLQCYRTYGDMNKAVFDDARASSVLVNGKEITVVGSPFLYGGTKAEISEGYAYSKSPASLASTTVSGSFNAGDEPSVSDLGITVTVTYDDGTTADVTSSVSISSGLPLVKGSNTLTLSYSEAHAHTGVEKDVECNITVSDVIQPVTSVNITSEVSQVNVGETITITAEALPANANNKTLTWSSNATDIATVDASSGVVTGVAAGTARITATSNNNVSAFVDVLVKDPTDIPTKLELSGTLAKDAYYVNEDFDPTGLTATLTMAKSGTIDVTSGVTWDPAKLTTAGENIEVTASYTLGTVTVSDSVNVRVVNREIDHFAFTAPTKLVYTQADTALDLDGMNAKAYYTLGDYEDITADVVLSEVDFTSATKQTVTVTYNEQTVGTFEVTVNELHCPLTKGQRYVLAGYDKKNSKYFELSSFTTTGTIYGNGTQYTSKYPLANGLVFTAVQGVADNSVALRIVQEEVNYYLTWLSGNSLILNTELNENASWYINTDSTTTSGLTYTMLTNVTDATRTVFWNIGYPRFATYANKSIGDDYGGTMIYEYEYCKAGNFVEDYMHPEIALDDKGTAPYETCKGTGYYDVAKPAFNALPLEVRTKLAEDEFEFHPYYERLLAWAKANGDELNSSHLLASGVKGAFSSEDSNEVATIVVIIAIASISAFGCLLILKKRKHQ